MVHIITKEPEFNDMPARCFTLPFVATECLCADSPHLRKLIFEDDGYRIFLALFSFVDVPEEIQLNSTLCGYFNKVVSYWLIKHPNRVIKFLAD